MQYLLIANRCKCFKKYFLEKIKRVHHWLYNFDNIILMTSQLMDYWSLTNNRHRVHFVTHYPTHLKARICYEGLCSKKASIRCVLDSQYVREVCNCIIRCHLIQKFYSAKKRRKLVITLLVNYIHNRIRGNFILNARIQIMILMRCVLNSYNNFFRQQILCQI